MFDGVRRAAPDSLLAALMLSFLATAGIFYVNIMPALVSGLIDGLGFTQRQAGFVGSANVYGAAFGALAIVPFVPRIDWRRASWQLLLALIALDALSLAVQAPWALTGLRALHGFAGGMLVGVAYSVFARTGAPDRTFGMLLLVQFGLGGLGVMMLPRLVPHFGTGVLFVALMAFSAVALAMLPFLSDYPRVAAPSPAPTLTPNSAAHTSGSAGTHTLQGRFVLALLALFLFQAANMALFAYIIELGESAGLSSEFVSTTVGASTWIGTLGCLLVIAIGTKFGRTLPLAIALVITLIGIWCLHHADRLALFFLVNAITGITWSLVMPYLLGLAAAFDRTGRSAALGGFASKLGLASGPFIGALVLRGDQYALLINLSCIGILLCAMAALPAARALDRAPIRD